MKIIGCKYRDGTLNKFCYMCNLNNKQFTIKCCEIIMKDEKRIYIFGNSHIYSKFLDESLKAEKR